MTKKNDKRILVTSALPYVNNIPHLGNIIGCVLSADVFARHKRLEGCDVLYVCGSDEHGTATETKALEEGLTPQQICDKYHAIHKDIYDWFNISFDHFGRTSDASQTERTQELFHHLEHNGYISEEEVLQTFCLKENKFLADRFIEGGCPHCGYEKAKGDQCDSCGKLLSPEELVNPKCKTCGSQPIKKATKHLFLRLDKLQPQLEEWVSKRSVEGSWSQNALTTTKGWFNEGLKPRAITRDLRWGVEVPRKGYENKVFYVWFDACIGYISITQQLLGDKWKDWWLGQNDVLLYQFMAKDNIPFHTIIFPATLIGSKQDYTMLYHIDSTEYLLYEGGKFSKSNNLGVFGDDAKNTGLSSDIFRYYLLINRPETADTNFSWDDLCEKVNNELVANLGNLVNRTTSFVANYLEGHVGHVDTAHLDEESKLFLTDISLKQKQVLAFLDESKIKEAFKEIFNLSRIGNQYFQKREPWKTRRDDLKKTNETLFVLINAVKDLGILLMPYLPDSSKKIFAQLNIHKNLDYHDLSVLSVKNHKIGKPEILFEKIDEKKIAQLKEKYGGQGPKHVSKSDNFSKLDLRVAKIVEIKKHPDADKLYVETIDAGSLGKKTIVSGLAAHYSEEELLGKNIVFIANLAPAKIRGVESQGMLLAGEDNKARVGVVLATNSEVGSRVFIDGKDLETFPEQITFEGFVKINKFEAVNGEVFFEKQKLVTKNEHLTIDRVKDGKIR